jgi:hypothetical protein
VKINDDATTDDDDAYDNSNINECKAMCSLFYHNVEAAIYTVYYSTEYSYLIYNSFPSRLSIENSTVTQRSNTLSEKDSLHLIYIIYRKFI